MNFSFLTEYITGDRLKSCAKVSYDFLRNPNLAGSTAKADIIWCKTDFVEEMFENMKNRTRPCSILTHNSDIAVGQVLYNKKPKCVKAWYAQNCLVVKKDLIPLPIGCENPRSPRGYSGDASVIDNYRRYRGERPFLALMNFNIANKPEKRQPLWDMFEGADWVSRVSYGISFKDCMRLTRLSKFVFCPVGNGMDTHRVWESLYLGAIPIVIECNMYKFFSDLPILMVDSWKRINKDMLARKWYEYKQRSWDISKMKLSYWKRRVRTGI